MVSESAPMKGKVGNHDLTKSGISDENFEILKKLEREYKEFLDNFNAKCKNLANTIPIKVYWSKTEPAPWGCANNGEFGELRDEWYCDHCPVQGICKMEKSWSK
jgi:hypothetical protein